VSINLGMKKADATSASALKEGKMQIARR